MNVLVLSSYLRRALRDAARITGRGPGAFVSAVVSTAVALSMAGAAILANSQIELAKSYWYDKVELSAFMCTKDSPRPRCDGDAGGDAVARVREQLATHPAVEKVYHETREQAWEQFRRRYHDSSVLNGVTAEAMPQSLRVKLREPDRRDEVIAFAAALADVEYVQDQKKMLRGFFNVLDMVKIAAGGFAVVQSFVAIVLIATSVRSALRHRTEEIRIMRLVGADARTIRAPFILVSMVGAAGGALVASLTLVAVKRLVIDPRVPSSTTIQIIGWAQVRDAAFVLLLVGCLSGWLVSRVTLRRALQR
jgi:cell division transport system permease protein